MKKLLPLAALLFILPVCAETISAYQAGPNTGIAFPGQSVTIASTGGPWDNIVFNFYSDASATTPTAFGTVFLLSQEYLGAPDDLSSSTVGYIAQAAASGGLYKFASGVTLQPGTQYFFYVNAEGLTSGNVTGSYSGGILYYANGGAQNFQPASLEDENFLLTGSPVPEPNSIVLLVSGLLIIGGVARRKLNT
jgi:hypothetical protein